MSYTSRAAAAPQTTPDSAGRAASHLQKRESESETRCSAKSKFNIIATYSLQFIYS